MLKGENLIGVMTLMKPDVAPFTQREIELVSTLRLDISLTWRHDSRAPANLKDDDVGLTTGFRYRIR